MVRNPREVVGGVLNPPSVHGEVDLGVIIPDHYGGREDPYEVFKVIRAWEVNFFLGNALKYIRRAGKKDPSKHIEDLEKAKEYLQSEIDHLKGLAQQPDKG